MFRNAFYCSFKAVFNSILIASLMIVPMNLRAFEVFDACPIPISYGAGTVAFGGTLLNDAAQKFFSKETYNRDDEKPEEKKEKKGLRNSLFPKEIYEY